MRQVKRILCPTDFSEGSLQALSAATSIAIKSKAELILLHALPILPTLPIDPHFAFEAHEYERLLRKGAKKHLNEMVQELQEKEKGLRATILVGLGDAASEIVRIAEQQEIDLIVIATFGKTGWRRFAFGSVTEKVVRLAPCPVLTFRGVEKHTVAERSTA